MYFYARTSALTTLSVVRKRESSSLMDAFCRLIRSMCSRNDAGDMVAAGEASPGRRSRRSITPQAFHASRTVPGDGVALTALDVDVDFVRTGVGGSAYRGAIGLAAALDMALCT